MSAPRRLLSLCCVSGRVSYFGEPGSYDVFVKGANRDALAAALGELGNATPGGTVRLRLADAMAQVGPAAAVVSIPFSADEAQVRELLQALDRLALTRDLALADSVDEDKAVSVEHRVARFRDSRDKAVERRRRVAAGAGDEPYSEHLPPTDVSRGTRKLFVQLAVGVAALVALMILFRSGSASCLGPLGG